MVHAKIHQMRVVHVVAISMALAVAGCGAAGPTQHFAATANAICKATNAQIEALPAPGRSPQSEASVLRKGFRYARTEVTKLDQLTAPGKREPIYVTALQSSQRLLALGKREIADFSAGRVAAANKLLDEGDEFSGETDAAMNALGATQCAADPQPNGVTR